MQTAADLSGPEVGASAPLLPPSPYLDHTIEPDDAENARLDENGYPVIVHAPVDAVNLNAPLMNLAAKTVGSMRPDSNHMGFFREAGKVVRNIVGPDGKFAAAPAMDLAIKIVDDPQCNPVALSLQLDTATSKEWRGWLPEHLCGVFAISDEDVASRDKLLATQVGASNSDVFSDWSLFVAVSAAFNHRRSNFQFLDKPTYLEAAWTCTCLRQLQPGVEFSAGVIRFLIAMMLEDGLVFFPWTGGPGLGLGVNDDKISAGLTDVSDLALKVSKIWETGTLHDVKPGDHDERDPLHVQLAKIVAAQEYIRAQRPTNPSEYETKSERET